MKVIIEKLTTGFVVELEGERHAFASLQRTQRFVKASLSAAGRTTVHWEPEHSGAWKKIQAIKDARHAFGIGLKEAKELIEAGTHTFPDAARAETLQEILLASGAADVVRV